MSSTETDDADLSAHRALIDACLRHLVPFIWHGPGTLLISASGIEAVVAEVTGAGFHVLAFEGFETDPAIHPRLDLIVHPTGGHAPPEPLATVRSWGDQVWIDVTLAPPRNPVE